MATYVTGNGNEQWDHAPAGLKSNVSVVYDPVAAVYRPAYSTDSAGSSLSQPSNYSMSGAAVNGTVFGANANRKYLYVQNLGINPLYIKFGSAGASNASMSAVLKAGTATGDGNGGIFTNDQGQITGLLSVSGVSSNYIAWEA